jgi:single-stranded DNA-binding protein
MAQIKVTFDGRIVADPEDKSFSSGAEVTEFPVYINHTRKNRDTGDYEDTGDVSKIKVGLWSSNPKISEWRDQGFRKGDIVEITGTLKEREWVNKEGAKGRALETDWVESVTLKYRKDEESVGAASASAPSYGGFDSQVPSGF